MDLHYSQTDENIVNSLLCFTTLWIYTTLKRFFICEFETVGFTTLWIYTTLKPHHDGNIMVEFYYLMDLHYSQTNRQRKEPF